MTELRIGALAATVGVNVQTVRYYERRGLLRSERTLGGHRVYPESAVTTLRVIRAAQAVGFTLAEIATMMDAAEHRHGRARRPAGLQAQTATKIAEIDAKIADLTVVRETLKATLDAGCDDLVECADNDCCPLPFVALVAVASR